MCVSVFVAHIELKTKIPLKSFCYVCVKTKQNQAKNKKQKNICKSTLKLLNKLNQSH